MACCDVSLARFFIFRILKETLSTLNDAYLNTADSEKYTYRDLRYRYGNILKFADEMRLRVQSELDAPANKLVNSQHSAGIRIIILKNELTTITLRLSFHKLKHVKSHPRVEKFQSSSPCYCATT